MWRGGSSLLWALLNKHPQVALMYEADLLLLRPVFLKPPFWRDWAARAEFWNRSFSRHGMDHDRFAGDTSAFPEAFEAVHQEYARRKGAAIWGDKSPNYYDRLLQMAKDFPRARFIILWRQPAETIGAAIRAAAGGNSYFGKRGTSLRSLLGSRVLKHQCDALLAAGAAVHQVEYHDLVSDTPAIMRSVCQFLQLPYDDSLSHLEGADRSAVYEGKLHSLLRGNVIVSGPRPNVIDSRLRTKIDHHTTLWRQTDSAENRVVSSSSRPPLAAMRLDWLRYRLYRTLDVCIRLAFCFLPIPLLHLYRKAKAYAREAKTKRDTLRVISTQELPTRSPFIDRTAGNDRE
jgi:hypothetical protein